MIDGIKNQLRLLFIRRFFLVRADLLYSDLAGDLAGLMPAHAVRHRAERGAGKDRILVDAAD